MISYSVTEYNTKHIDISDLHYFYFLYNRRLYNLNPVWYICIIQNAGVRRNKNVREGSEWYSF